MLAAMCLSASAQTEKGLWFQSTEGNIWQLNDVELADEVVGTPEIVLDLDDTQQTFKGWGTCFNELGWDALNLLPQETQEQIMSRMFSPDGDLRFTIGRLSPGANDYARSWYSCNETDGDFEMENFSIERDKEAIIPYIQFAQQYNPDMTFWCSPWSPPTWMKTNGHYANKSGYNNGLSTSQQVPVYFNDQFIMEDDYLNAYCLYFAKFIEAYAELGIPITTLMYQNEAYSYTVYPSCSWTAAGTAKFLGSYLGPYFAEHHPEVKLVVGTMNTSSLDVFEEILSDEGVQKYCSGVGFQWEGRQALREVAYRHPDMTLEQTESECGSGTFDWSAGAHTFYLINQYLWSGCEKYTYWNAVLKDDGSSTWGWLQNSLIRVDSGTCTAEYTPEYYAFKHYSHFLPAGSVILGGSTGIGTDALVLAARTPDGAIVVVAGNNTSSARKVTMSVDGRYLSVTLPANSFNTFVFGDKGEQLQVLIDEANATDTTALSEETAARLTSAVSTATALVDSEDDSAISASIDDLMDVLKDIADETEEADADDMTADLEDLCERGTEVLESAYSGADEYSTALSAAQTVLAADDATASAISEAYQTLLAATATYLATAEADSDNPADFTGMILNPEFADGDSDWTLANVLSSGDCRAATIQGRTCYNNWSNDFTSLDIHQDIKGLPQGIYALTCYSLCGPGEISDQHAYLTADDVTATSPVKELGLWSTAGWEEQTTATIIVDEDGQLRVGYASTSGGGTCGWFCVTGFSLKYYGLDITSLTSSLTDALTTANSALEGALLAADKTRLQKAITSAEAVLNDIDNRTSEDICEALSDLLEALSDVEASNTAMTQYTGTTVPAAEATAETLANATAQQALKSLLSAQSAEIASADADAETVTECDELLEASLDYFSTLDEAVTLAADATGLYDSDVQAQLSAIIEAQTAMLSDLDDAVEFADLTRQLNQYMLLVRKTQQPGEDSDYTFAILSPDVETYDADGNPEGWELQCTNGDATVKSGEHYSGDTSNHYFDSYHATSGWLYYTGHQSIDGLPNGTYMLKCAARSSGEGAFITAKTATQYLMEEIAKQGTNGNDGGPIWEEAESGSAEKSVNSGNGYGWQNVRIQGILVTDNTLDIGFTNDKYLTGKAWTGTWFSVDDFELYYLSADVTPVGSITAESDDDLRALTTKGTIIVTSGAPYAIYNVAGMRVNRTTNLPSGIYIVKSGTASRKVLVP